MSKATITIGAIDCDIELNDAAIPVLQIFHSRNENYIRIYCVSDTVFEYVSINGAQVQRKANRRGFSQRLYNLPVYQKNYFEYTLFRKMQPWWRLINAFY